jgi:hypothetical protein
VAEVPKISKQKVRLIRQALARGEDVTWVMKRFQVNRTRAQAMIKMALAATED